MTAFLAGVAGCAAPTTIFRITDHRGPAAAQQYRETFDEAYYRIDRAGNVDVVARRSVAGKPPAPPIRQVIHLHGLWPSIPGRTVADRTQINATVTYAIESGALRAVFEGAGSLFLDTLKPGERVVGELELATLRPTHRSETAGDMFERAEIRGQFNARHDPRKVVRVVNELKRSDTGS